MKIVLTLHKFGQGGTDRVSCLLATGFIQAGYDVDLLVFCEGGLAKETLSNLLDDRVKVAYLGEDSGSRTKDLVKYLRKAAEWLRRADPDCILSTGNNMHWITAASLRLSGLEATKLVFKTTNPIIRPEDGSFARAFRKHGYRRAFNRADLILTLSDAETLTLMSDFPSAREKLRTVINPYVSEEMLKSPAENCTGSFEPEAQKLILGVGRLGPQKRFDLLIRAFARISDKNTRLVILGEGPARTNLADLVCKLGLEGRVDMPGFVTDVGSWFHSADLFVLSSVYEGLPAVIFEALAGNCPVVSTNCFASVHELLDGLRNSSVVDTLNVQDLADAIMGCLSGSRPTENNQIAEKYSYMNGVRSHVTALEELLVQPASFLRPDIFDQSIRNYKAPGGKYEQA